MSTPLHARHQDRLAGRDLADVPVARVDLLPSEIVTGRRVRVVQRRGLVALAAVAALMAASYGWSWLDEGRAGSALEAERSTLAGLRSDLDSYVELIQLQTASVRIERTLGQIMVDDVAWDRYLQVLVDTAPAGVVMSNLALEVRNPADGGSGGDSGVTSGDLDLGDTEHIGTLLITGQAPDHDVAQSWVAALEQVDGFRVPYLLGSEVLAEGGVQFTVAVTLATPVRSNRFASTTEVPTS